MVDLVTWILQQLHKVFFPSTLLAKRQKHHKGTQMFPAGHCQAAAIRFKCNECNNICSQAPNLKMHIQAKHLWRRTIYHLKSCEFKIKKLSRKYKSPENGVLFLGCLSLETFGKITADTLPVIYIDRFLNISVFLVMPFSWVWCLSIFSIKQLNSSLKCVRRFICEYTRSKIR